SDHLELRDGHELDLVARRDGSTDLVVDGTSVHLAEDEADAVARVLGTPEIVTRLAQTQLEADGLLIERVPIPAHSPYAGRRLGDTRMRGRTGASIVAVIGETGVQPSPKPEFVLNGGDLVVAVGTREGLDSVGRILDGTG
ncbi:cation:proton antiporter regulatory subunit, partial [Jatrophihabitans endophyticus]|uniref:cation:proton antiporter regulatory subunit n=1 Tax=Jatrophihabitans endophyticus TaxID=1206085 RepID=UPI001A033E64